MAVFVFAVLAALSQLVLLIWNRVDREPALQGYDLGDWRSGNAGVAWSKRRGRREVGFGLLSAGCAVAAAVLALG